MLSRVPTDGKAWSSPSLTASHFIISEEVVILKKEESGLSYRVAVKC